MSSIKITNSTDFWGIIDDMNAHRRAFYDLHVDINKFIQNMCNTWTGDASTAFLDRWNNEYENFATIDNLLLEYNQELKNIHDEWATAEAYNKAQSEG